MQQHKCQLILENDELERRDRDRFDCERIARNDLITSSSHFFYQNIHEQFPFERWKKVIEK